MECSECYGMGEVLDDGSDVPRSCSKACKSPNFQNRDLSAVAICVGTMPSVGASVEEIEKAVTSE